jgi:hypothetical protein
MKPDATSKTIRSFLLAFSAVAAAFAFSGCAQESGMRTSGGNGMSSGSGSAGIGDLTGGAEANPTSAPGVTPGKKP